MSDSELYLSKENRDHRARALKAEGFTVIRKSIRNPQLHPMYIRDWELLHGRRLSREERGFGNNLYTSVWPILYIVKYGLTRLDAMLA